MAMMPSASAGNPYEDEHDTIIEQDLLEAEDCTGHALSVLGSG